MSKRYPGGLIYQTQLQYGSSFILPITTTSTNLQSQSIGAVPPASSFKVDYIVVAGGGGGGGNTGGGGGGGGVLTGAIFCLTGHYLVVTVGSGGNGGAAAAYSYPSGGQIGARGNNSTLEVYQAFNPTQNWVYYPPITALGGGGSTGWDVGNGDSFKHGGSGAGGSNTTVRGWGVVGQGNYGGLKGSSQCSAGGGGAGAIGNEATGTGASSVGGNGGAGLTWLNGTTYGGGGGGGGGTSDRSSGATGCPAGSGGSGGGGAGAAGSATTAITGNNGSANTGGGGGGGNFRWNTWGGAGGAGGSGIVIIRYLSSLPAATSTTGSPTVTTSGGYRYYTFTANGTLTF